MLRQIFCFLIMVLAAMPLHAKDQAFTIEDIQINEAYENLGTAREDALNKATHIAFQQLIEKLSSSPLDMINFEEIDPSSYVSTYDIKNEKISRKHYEAVFGINFNPALIRQFFKQHNIAYSEIQIKPVLIIPVFDDNGTKKLWEEKTDWFRAWQNYSDHHKKVSIIVPNGDIHDLTKLSAADIQSDNMHAFRKMMMHYQTSMILISEIQPISPQNIVVKNKLYNMSRLIDQSRLEVSVTDDMDKTYDDIQAYVLNDLWNFRKESTVISDHEEKVLRTSIAINSLQNLVTLEKKLEDLSFIKSYTIDQISNNQVSLTIYYIGSEDTLREHIFSF